MEICSSHVANFDPLTRRLISPPDCSEPYARFCQRGQIVAKLHPMPIQSRQCRLAEFSRDSSKRKPVIAGRRAGERVSWIRSQSEIRRNFYARPYFRKNAVPAPPALAAAATGQNHHLVAARRGCLCWRRRQHHVRAKRPALITRAVRSSKTRGHKPPPSPHAASSLPTSPAWHPPPQSFAILPR